MILAQRESPLGQWDYQKQYEFCEGQHSQTKRSMVVTFIKANLSDTPLVHEWMNHPHVYQFWQQAHSLHAIEAYLKRQIASYHEVFIGYVNSQPVAYLELYPVAEDPLAQHCEHHPNDWGWHILIGPGDFIGCGLSPAIGYTVLHYLFEQKRARQVFCEPDVRNLRMINFVRRLQHKDLGEIQLDNKSARLMACKKEHFEAFTLPTLIYQSTQEPLI